MDEFTASQKLLTYARLNVEVDLSKDLPSLIWIDQEDSNPIEISVEYENLPCSSCLLPGHGANSCPQSVKDKAPSPPKSSPLKLALLPKTAVAGILGPPPESITDLDQHLNSSPVIDLDLAKPPSTVTVQMNPFDLLDQCSMKDHFRHSRTSIPIDPFPDSPTTTFTVLPIVPTTDPSIPCSSNGNDTTRPSYPIHENLSLISSPTISPVSTGPVHVINEEQSINQQADSPPPPLSRLIPLACNPFL